MIQLYDYVFFWAFVLIFAFFLVATVGIAKVLSGRKPNPSKEGSYECGQIPPDKASDHPISGIAHYFIYAVVFFIFDAFLWVLMGYVQATQSLTSFIGFVTYLVICSTGLWYFLRYVQMVKK